MKFKELNFILRMNENEFIRASQKASSEEQKTRAKAEKPITMRANVAGLMSAFAKVGLALNGIQQTYRLIIGPMKEFSRLSDVQEKAEARLAVSLQNAGDATQGTLRAQMEFATEIQRTTTVGDEQAMMLQSMALNMQAPIDKIQDVVRNAIALSKAFSLDMNVAIRAATAALDDDYSMLTRYIPAMRGASDEAQKAAVYQRTVADGWRTATDELNTNAGAVEDFQNTIGDFKEDLGDFIKVAVVPLIRVLKPLLTAFTDLDRGTQQAIIGTTLFIGIAIKARGALIGMRAAVFALQASMGPTGWLILGIGAAATALGFYTTSAHAAESANTDLEQSNRDVAQSFEEVREAAQKAYGKQNIEEIRKVQAFFRAEMEKSRQELINLQERQKQGDQEVTQEVIANAERRYRLARDRERALGEVIRNKLEPHKEVETALTEEEQKELDKRREYEFESNRISLSQYVIYLESRQEALKAELGADTAEWLRWYDRLQELQIQLQAEQTEILKPPSPETVNLIDTTFDNLNLKAIQVYQNINDISTQFYAESYQQLRDDYIERILTLENWVENARVLYGENSRDYQALMEKKLALERGFQDAKTRLAVRGIQENISLGADLMNAFQGQSETMFQIGKGYNVAEAWMNAILASQRAFKDYPFPANLAISALQFTLAYAKMKQLEKVEFRPAGKKQGGAITMSDIIQSRFTPSGEDGIVGVQIGEWIADRKTTSMFYPELEAMRAHANRRDVPGYQSGGQVTQVAQPVTIDMRQLGSVVEDAIYAGFRRSRLRIQGNFIAKGRDLQAALDKDEELRSQL